MLEFSLCVGHLRLGDVHLGFGDLDFHAGQAIIELRQNLAELHLVPGLYQDLLNDAGHRTGRAALILGMCGASGQPHRQE
jgi:hypothetical protein